MEGGEPVVNTLLKTPAAKRDVPIPKCLVTCLKEERGKSESEYVILEFEGNCFDGNTVCESLEVHNSPFYCRTLLLHFM